MKQLIILTSLYFLSPAHAELQALSNNELESSLSTITAFQSPSAPTLLTPQDTTLVNSDLRIQQEINALRISTGSSLKQPIQLENQLLQGPNSSINVINSNLLNF